MIWKFKGELAELADIAQTSTKANRSPPSDAMPRGFPGLSPPLCFAPGTGCARGVETTTLRAATNASSAGSPTPPQTPPRRWPLPRLPRGPPPPPPPPSPRSTPHSCGPPTRLGTPAPLRPQPPLLPRVASPQPPVPLPRGRPVASPLLCPLPVVFLRKACPPLPWRVAPACCSLHSRRGCQGWMRTVRSSRGVGMRPQEPPWRGTGSVRSARRSTVGAPSSAGSAVCSGFPGTGVDFLHT